MTIEKTNKIANEMIGKIIDILNEYHNQYFLDDNESGTFMLTILVHCVISTVNSMVNPDGYLLIQAFTRALSDYYLKHQQPKGE